MDENIIFRIFDTQDYNVFPNGATCDDIIQGSLGDFYFLSVLASLCTYQKIIKKLFIQQKNQKIINMELSVS